MAMAGWWGLLSCQGEVGGAGGPGLSQLLEVPAKKDAVVQAGRRTNMFVWAASFALKSGRKLGIERVTAAGIRSGSFCQRSRHEAQV